MPTKITEMLSGCEIATLESGVPVAEHMYNQGRQPPVTLISIALRNLKPDLENIINRNNNREKTLGDAIFRQGSGKGNWKGEEQHKDGYFLTRPLELKDR